MLENQISLELQPHTVKFYLAAFPACKLKGADNQSVDHRMYDLQSAIVRMIDFVCVKLINRLYSR